MKAALQVRHSHMRAASLARNLLVVDEVHASDQYMRVILQALLDIHIGSGGYALLMSATLGSAARRQLLLRPRRVNAMALPSLEDAVSTPYPAITTLDAGEERVEATVENNQRKNVRIESTPAMHEFATVARLALEAARAGVKTLIIRNTVGHAVETQRAIESAAEAEVTSDCCSPAATFQLCTPADTPPKTGASWTNRSSRYSAGIATLWVAWSSERRRWSSLWTSTPICSSPICVPWMYCFSVSGVCTVTAIMTDLPDSRLRCAGC